MPTADITVMTFIALRHNVVNRCAPDNSDNVCQAGCECNHM